MEVRIATEADLDAIEVIVDTARAFMRAHGNQHQWINGYPSRACYAEDIQGGHCFVVTENDEVHAVFSLFTGDDPTYGVIDDGQWLDNEPYACIHRIGSDGKIRGALKAAVVFAQTVCPVLRADTHADNYVMQNALKKCGFIRCGVIYVADGSPREAFERPRQA